MIEGGWPFVWAAYALTGVSFVTLIAVVLMRARYWARRAQDLARQ